MSLPNLRVMLLTDDIMQANLIKMVLKTSNIEVAVVLSHFEMIAGLDVALPDLILADWEVEGLNGREIITELRQIVYGLERVPSILMTQREVNENTRLNMNVDGFRWVLQKPVVITSLPKLVEHTIQNNRLRKRMSATHYVQYGETASQAIMKAVV